MNTDARQGQRIIMAIIIGLFLDFALMLALPGGSLRSQALRLAIVVAMSVLMWRGYSWARSYMAFSLAMAAVLTVLSGMAAMLMVWWGAGLLVLAPLYAWGAWVLWNSPKVEAYIEYRERQRNPDMSFTQGA